MNSEPVFKSVLTPFFQSYMDDFEARGKSNVRLRYVLRSIDKYLCSVSYIHDYITQTAYDGWAASMEGLDMKTIYENKKTAIAFCRYMCELGHDSYIAPMPKWRQPDYIPYIYSEDELTSIFKATDNWRDHQNGKSSTALIMPAFVRLLYSTGMRAGEALDIRNRDVDFNRHVICLCYTKNREDRLAPINPSLEMVLKQYIRYRNQLPIDGIDRPDGYLFVNLRGERCLHSAVLRRYRLMLKSAGVPFSPSENIPRLHDLRHTACVHSLVRMVRNGYDPYVCLPMLCKFMGHHNVDATEYYLRLTKDMYPDLIKMDATVTSMVKDVISRALIIKDNEGQTS